MLGLTPLGIVHTAFSLVAVGAGVLAIVRDKEITPKSGAGKLFIAMTVLTCLTGFGIFQHGGFGKPHVLGVVTLVVLSVAALAGGTVLFGRLSAYVEAVSYSFALFLHAIPGMTETLTRFPLGAPLIADRESPTLQAAASAAFVLFLIGATFQVLRMMALRRSRPSLAR